MDGEAERSTFGLRINTCFGVDRIRLYLKSIPTEYTLGLQVPSEKVFGVGLEGLVIPSEDVLGALGIDQT